MLQQLVLMLFTMEAKYYSSVGTGGVQLLPSSCLARASASESKSYKLNFIHTVTLGCCYGRSFTSSHVYFKDI